MEIILEGCLIDKMKHFDILLTMQKSTALCKVPFMKNQEKPSKMAIFSKTPIFGGFLAFSEIGLRRELGFFCVVISSSKRFI